MVYKVISNNDQSCSSLMCLECSERPKNKKHYVIRNENLVNKSVSICDTDHVFSPNEAVAIHAACLDNFHISNNQAVATGLNLIRAQELTIYTHNKET